MMATTHAFTGLLICVPLAMLFPDQSASIALMALVGGVFPDFDVFIGQHRRTLHFPVGYWLPLPLAVGSVLLGFPEAAPIVAFFLGAASHSISDILGGGLEKEPWKQTATRAVYCHATASWIAPKYIFAYDGSRGDLFATCILATSVFAYSGVPYLTLLVGAGVAVATGYTVIRRRLPALEDWLYEKVPLAHSFLDGLH